MASELISRGIRYTSLPESYVRPPSERPRLDEVEVVPIPIVDIGGEDREVIVRQIGEACRDFGFFQVIKHGIGRESTEQIMEVAREFFHMPIEEKSKFYSDDPAKKMRLSTSFNVKKETVHNWRDYLRLHCHPLREYSHEWPSNPSSFK